MILQGKIKTITLNYPYHVTMEDGQQFTSHFLFKKGMEIRLHLSGDMFTCPWPTGGFVICHPNGIREIPMTPEAVATAKNPDSQYFEHRLPSLVRLAITTGKPQHWVKVESFYEYHYISEFDPKTNILRTNYVW